MRLKSFYAKTMTEAMKMVRETLGDDAVIVATREEKGGKAVHVTAAVEPGLYDSSYDSGPHFEVGETAKSARRTDWLQYDDEDEESAVTEEITDAMLRHSVPEDVMDHIISCATVIGMDDPGTALIAAIEHLFSFAPLPLKPLGKAVMLVGPPGAGKTLGVAKLATRGVMKGLRVGVVTTDTVRAGGVEQLAAFTNLLRTDLYQVDNQEQMKGALKELGSCEQIFIDTQGINPFDPQEVKEVARLIGMGSAIQPLLVLPAGMDAEESGEVARAFSAIGVQHLLPTRLDIARRLGGLLSAAHHGHMAFTQASDTPKVADGLVNLSPQKMSQLLMPGAFRGKEPLDTARGSSDHSRKRAYQ